MNLGGRVSEGALIGGVYLFGCGVSPESVSAPLIENCTENC